jgi:guanylate kinase
MSSEKLLGNLKEGLLFVISAPSGTGKTTLAQMLCDEFPAVVRSISATTRAPRSNEKEGIDYYFISKDQFEKEIQEKKFLEYAKVFDNYYGTRLEHIKEKQRQGKHVLLVIDTQGALQVREKLPAILIFIAPPSMEELKNRMIKRHTEAMELIEKRLSWAEKEMETGKKYDYLVINDDLNTAYTVLKSILIAEERRKH